jgi:capsular polysaccharide export protein
MDRWKRGAIAAAFPGASFAEDAAQGVARARASGGALAVWATRVPPGLVETAAAAGVPLLWVEDGFLRSVGLGVNFVTAASLCVDPVAPHYDPARETGLERLLAARGFDAALLARAAALRARIAALGLTKYNLGRPAPKLPPSPGRRRILVPGQVTDDASVRLGGRGMDNLGLLAAVRAANPDAFIAYRPHPDVETGYRRGFAPRRALLRHADVVVAGGDIAGLYAQVEEVHTLTSLAGFEALLRGLPVATHGQPFYAGWGLTTDFAPLPRRARRLALDELVAGALILYPRYTDPVTGQPCEAEALLDRLAEPDAWPALPRARQLYDRLWWRPQGWLLKQARRLGVLRR